MTVTASPRARSACVRWNPMNPTPPVTTQRLIGASTQLGAAGPLRRGPDAHALVTQPGFDHIGGAPDVASVDDRCGEPVRAGLEALLELGEVRGAIAAPLGEKHDGVGAVERLIIPIDHC